MYKNKIFFGTFYPLQTGEILKGRDHYNYKLPLTDYFDIKQYCYNSDVNKLEIVQRKENNRKVDIIRFNKASDDIPVIDNLFKSWKPEIWQAHGGQSGDKVTVKKLIDKYSDIKWILEYGGGYDKNSMMQHYYNPKVEKLILNHHLWRQFFPDDYQSKIVITPFNQSVDSNRFKPKPEIEKVYDVMTLGRYDGGNKGHGILYELLKNEEDIRVLLMGDDIPLPDTKNIVVKSSDYDHSKIVDILNSSKMFAWGTRKAIENPFCIHVRVVAEALACGLPVIAFKDSFVESNLVIHEKTGLLAGTDEEFVDNIKLLQNDKDLYNELSVNARKKAVQADTFTFLNFYKDLWETQLK